MRTLKLTILALALTAALPTKAADPALDLKKEMQALKDRITELEKAPKAAPAPATPAAVAPAGMTDQQVKDFNRIAVKTEALEDGQEASGFKGLKISGYMDPTYVYSFNKERGTFQFMVPISKEAYSYDNGYFGTLALDLVKETDNGTKFHLTLYPKRGGGDVMGENSIVHEASVWIPLGDLSTKLFAGQIPDWSGYEYYAPNLYKNITHNMLFDFTLPASYTGVGLELVRGKLDLKLMLANMNASVRNIGENIPMFVFRGDYAVGEFWGFGFAGAAGYKPNFRASGTNPVTDEPYASKDSLYTTVEVDGWYTRGNLSLNTHLAYGSQEKAAITPDPVTGNLRASQWFAISALAAYKLTARTEGVLRGDFIYNQKNGGGLLDYTIPDPSNGIGPDQDGGDPEKGANRFAITAGLNYALTSNVILKAEYRYDGADRKVFGNKDLLLGGSNPKVLKSNSLVATSAVFFF
jgi:opacity protein-like surface antigen